ncbi:Inner nuclear membrane protein SRC1 [Spathaspora sp. JA1]|nr:Inner nuclear membrane protein SRC1 [Spathaspora sp. JA1]
MSYLEEGFDPQKLKVAELRNILNRHEVEYPSNAKKTQLVQLFKDNIVSKRQELSQEFNVKPSDEGIVSIDLDSSDSSSNEDDGGNSDDKDIEIIDVDEEEINKNDVEISRGSIEESVSSPKSKSSTPTPNKSSATKKRKRVEEVEIEADPSIAEETPSKKVAKTLKSLKRESPKKTIFDDSSSDVEMFVKDTTGKAKLEKTTPKSSSKTTPKSVSSSKKTPKLTPSKITKPASKKTTPTTSKKTTPATSKNTTLNESFKSPEEEEKHFNKELSKIKGRSTSSHLDDIELAKSLGITIEGFQPPPPPPPQSVEEITRPLQQLAQDVVEIAMETIATPKLQRISSVSLENSMDEKTTPKSKKSTPKRILEEETPKRSPVVKSVLTPKPRLIPIPAKTTSDTDDEEDEVVEKEENQVPESMTQNKLSETPKDNQKGASNISITQPLTTFIIWALVVLSGLFGYWYMEQSFLVGYCGQEIYTETFQNSDNPILHHIGKFLDEYAKPNCVPCPPHGRCFPNLELACYEDFIEFKPWTNFFIPGNKKCIPDTKKAEKLEIMMEVALDLIRSKNAQVQCGKGRDDFESGISVQDLHDLLLAMKAPYITLEEFEELWERSVVELEKEPEIIKRSSNFPQEYSNVDDSYGEEETLYLLTMDTRDNLLKQSIDTIDSIGQWHSSKSFNYKLKSGGDIQVQTFKTLIANKSWFARTSNIPTKYHDKLIHCITGTSEPGTTHSDYEQRYIDEITSVECSEICQFPDGWSYKVKAKYDFGLFIQKRVFYELVNIYKGDGYVYVISQAVKGEEGGFVVGTYDSIERITWTEDNKLIWTMATTSNPGGLIPTWLTNLTIPSAIAKDVPRVLNLVSTTDFST